MQDLFQHLIPFFLFEIVYDYQSSLTQDNV